MGGSDSFPLPYHPRLLFVVGFDATFVPLPTCALRFLLPVSFLSRILFFLAVLLSCSTPSIQTLYIVCAVPLPPAFTRPRLLLTLFFLCSSLRAAIAPSPSLSLPDPPNPFHPSPHPPPYLSLPSGGRKAMCTAGNYVSPPEGNRHLKFVVFPLLGAVCFRQA